MAEQEVFTIRAHHLALIEQSYRVGADVACKQLIKNIQQDTKKVHGGLTYAEDVCGQTEAEADAVYQKILEYLERYSALDELDPVIVNQSKDGICSACINGHHCNDGEGDGSENKYIISLESLLRVYARLVVGEYVLRVLKPWVYNGVELSGCRVIETNKKTLENILSRMANRGGFFVGYYRKF